MNKIILMGRLTRDVELKYSQGATPLAIGKFTIAVDRKKKVEGSPGADFFNCVTFGGQAEFVGKYMRKGTKVVVIGRIENDSYTNKDGVKVYYSTVIVDDIEFAESKAASNGDNVTGNAAGNTAGGTFSTGNVSDAGVNRTAPASNTAVSGGGYAWSEGFMNIPEGIEEELPFNC